MTLDTLFSNNFQNTNHFVNFKLAQILKYTSKIISSIVALAILFFSVLAIIGFAATTQKTEADFGLRHQNISTKQVNFYAKIKQALLDAPQASAFSLNPLDGIGEIIAGALKGVTKPIFEIVLGLIKGVVLPIIDAVVQPIIGLLNGILDTINSFLGVIDNLASNLSGTRIGIGFKIYADIEGKTGQGSSNFESSSQFAKKLLDKAIDADFTKNPNIFNSSFPKADEVKKLVTDTIAWSDFMSVQKSMQSNIIGDYSAAFLNLNGLVNFDTINRDLTDIIVGKKCEGSNAIFQVPVYDLFGTGLQTTCDVENRGSISQMIKSRQDYVQSSTLQKSTQYEVQLPADCKYGQYFDIAEGAEIKYDENKPGDLGSKISTFAGALSTKNISAAECQALKTGKQDQTKSIVDLLSPANLTAAFGAGAPLSVALSTFVSTLGKTVFDSISAKFNKAVTIVRSLISGSQVKSGIGLYGAMINVIGLKSKINSRINALNQEYEQFRNSGNARGFAQSLDDIDSGENFSLDGSDTLNA